MYYIYKNISIYNDKIDISYDYLLSMPIYNLTNEKIEELKKQETEKQSEFDSLIEKTPEQLWIKDLEELDLAYDKWMETKQKDASNEVGAKKKKTLLATK